MKTFLMIIILACLVQAQEKTEVKPIGVSGTTAYISLEALQKAGHLGIADADSLEAICKERGHVRSNYCSMTLLANIPQYIDLSDRTLRITHDRNTITYRCQRCGKGFSEPVQAEPDTMVIWKK
jgi:hypothetical protein